MSFANTPVKQYGPWKANKEFVQFFENMKKRRIPGNSNSPTLRVTNKSPTTNQTMGKKQKSIKKVNYSSPSEVITNSAKALGGSVYKTPSSSQSIKRGRAGALNGTLRKKTPNKKKRVRKERPIESKIKKQRF